MSLVVFFIFVNVSTVSYKDEELHTNRNVYYLNQMHIVLVQNLRKS